MCCSPLPFQQTAGGEKSRRKRTSEAGVDRDGNSPAAFPMILLRFPFIFVISHPIYGNDGNIITELSVAVKARSTGCLFGMPIALFEYSVSCGNGRASAEYGPPAGNGKTVDFHESSVWGRDKDRSERRDSHGETGKYCRQKKEADSAAGTRGRIR